MRRLTDKSDSYKSVNDYINDSRRNSYSNVNLSEMELVLPEEKSVFIEKIEETVNESLNEILQPANEIICRFYEIENFDRSSIQKLLQDLVLQISILEEMSYSYGLERDVAKQSFEDKFWSEYRHPVEGTQNDRIAYANTQSKEEVYVHIFKEYWSNRIDYKLRQLKDLRRTIEMIFNKSWF